MTRTILNKIYHHQKVFMNRCAERDSSYLVNLPPLYIVSVLDLRVYQNRSAYTHVWHQYTQVPLGYMQLFQPRFSAKLQSWTTAKLTTWKTRSEIRISRPENMFAT